MFHIDENDIYELRQLRNKVELLYTLNVDNLRTRPLQVTSQQLATIFNDLASDLNEIIHHVEDLNKS